ncbi:zinc finger bed domain-containing protein 1-like protein [Lasius niger]|uniref:Zinc finger bed domain-containing protein 1-like protein n=1 Tax=Lasius niger TaxID=67767 RepID=A0A0J7KEG9_LASNI|nr:zinc finger bed domain-containing protein 1-like protein [Lasius niger]
MDIRNDNDKAFEYVRNLSGSGKIVNDDKKIETLFRSIDDVNYTLIKSTENDARDSQAQEEITPTKAPPKSSGVTNSKSDASHALFCSQANRLKRKARVTSGSSDDSIDDPPQPKRVKHKPQGKLTRIDEAFEHTNSFLEGGKTSDKFTNAILYMIAVDKMPLSTVQNEGFKLLMKTVALFS